MENNDKVDSGGVVKKLVLNDDIKGNDISSNLNDKTDNNVAIGNEHTILSPRSGYLLDHYRTIGEYLGNWVEAVALKWKGHLSELRDILKKYSTPHIDIPISIDELDEDDLSSESDRFLNTYTTAEILGYLEKYGILKILASRGYGQTKIIPDYTDAFVHRIKLTDATIESARGGDALLIDIFIRRKDLYLSDFVSKDAAIASSPSNAGRVSGEIARHLPRYVMQGEPYIWSPDEPSYDIVAKHIGAMEIKTTIIEWLSLQDPKKTFSNDRPPLPGQQYPGLGVARQMDSLLVQVAGKSGRDCLLNTPYRFYNAFMYQSSEYFFVDPSIQSYFLSLLGDLEQDIEKLGLAPVSWAFEFGCVREKSTGNRVKWEFHKQIRPLSNRLKAYFKSSDYTSYVERNTRKGMFYIDWAGHPSIAHFYKPISSDTNNNTNDNIKEQSDNSNLTTNSTTAVLPTG